MTHGTFTIDNRDTNTTWLHVEDTNIVLEVDPMELLQNMLENANVTDLYMERIRDLIHDAIDNAEES